MQEENIKFTDYNEITQKATERIVLTCINSLAKVHAKKPEFDIIIIDEATICVQQIEGMFNQ